MPSEWLLTVQADCDLDQLTLELSSLGVRMVPTKRPIPLDKQEMAVTVQTDVPRLSNEVVKLKGVLRAHPSSKMTRF